MTPKQKADEIFTHYHNLIQEQGGELGQEILVSILARQCAMYAVRLLLNDKHPTEDFNESYFYWVRVEEELNKM